MKRTIGWMAMAVAILVAPTMAQAGFTMGARLGYAIPGGEIENGADLGDFVSSSVPIMFHLGGAFAQNRASIEGFFEISPASLDSDLEDACDYYGYSCSALGMRLGVMGTFRFMPEQFASPWVGAGLGWEIFVLDLDVIGTGTYTGTTFELMGGLDLKAGPVFSWGPFVSLQFGTYTDVEVDEPGYGTYSYDPDAGTHTWLQIGIRGKFDFGGGGGGGGYAPGPGY